MLVVAVTGGLTQFPIRSSFAQTPPTPSPSPAGSSAPASTEAEHRADELLKLFESCDYSSIAGLVKNSFGLDFVAAQGENDLINYLADTVRRTGGIRRGKILPNGNEAIGFFKSNLTDRWGAIQLTVEETPPYRITSLLIQRAKAPASATAEPASEKARLAQITAFATKLTKADLFSGVIAIARNDKPIFTKAFGVADRNFGVATTNDTRFALGGLDKTITAIAVAQLVEAGKLSYDDPLSKFVDYPDKASAGKIQIKHLLSNTSGLGDYNTDKYHANVRRLNDVQSYFTILDHKPPGFTPGTNWQDSGVGFVMLGRVIELASGEDFYEYVQHHIFEPAGMQHSSQDYLLRVNPKSAVRYEDYFVKDHFVTSIYGYLSPPPVRGAPDNATVATAEDMVRFVAALRNGKLVSPDTYKLMTTPKPELGAKTYGYGFMMNFGNQEGRDVIGHSGDAPGICTDYAIIRDLKEPYTVVVLSNTSTMGHAVTEAILSLYKGAPTQP
jgi:CubicO group peptidase (beta-lactamase class C family)